MKRILSIVIACLFCFSLAACTKTYKGIDELMEKAREEIPISDSDTIDMQYAGMCEADGKAIVWFLSGNEYQSHYYLSMEVEIKNNGAEYAFVRTYKPMMDRTGDIASWNQGYAFLINDPEVKTVQATLQNGEVVEEAVQEGTVPYTFYVPFIPSEYVFLDTEGNEVQ